ncbi:UvrD-helicase domain-containing protein [Terasakiella pusilla]|uniref:UvrD-helicase domain-containing protein n=1 Tax=Terasakiella pusilla TaxID=64973 RepID=UPI003AA99D6C
MSLEIKDDNTFDAHVDDEILHCIEPSNLQSFFLFAGAGSGKTRSLVNVLERFLEKYVQPLRLAGQKVGVITYTNAACDEIKERLKFHPLIDVKTINSFVWSLIQGFDRDIREWLRGNLVNEINELNALQAKGRAGTKAAAQREASLESKNRRLAALDQVRRFKYNPDGDNEGRDSLNHAEVIKISASFLKEKDLMQKILTSGYPILLIDESQDTHRPFMEALFEVQAMHEGHFALGLIGDTMQRIYGHGKKDLGENLPESWAKPVKKMNHRSASRIVTLINKIRADVDGQEQRPRSDRGEGSVRLFIVDNASAQKGKAETVVCERMAEITSDDKWTDEHPDVKTLILEHHMAASRMGFGDMFAPLYSQDRLKTGLLDGSLPEVRLFSDQVYPLVKAKEDGDDFAVAAIIKKHSPLMDKKKLKENAELQLLKARDAVNALAEVTQPEQSPTFLDVLKVVAQSQIFFVPERLRQTLRTQDIELKLDIDFELLDGAVEGDEEEVDDNLDILTALDEFLAAPFNQIEPYQRYVTGEAQYDTHQGVKGLEFPRVMVVIDDEESRGFMFDYEKLFGAKALSEGDKKKLGEGEEIAIQRTKRLFYVTCSRAEKSLAIVACTNSPKRVKEYVLEQGWFASDEIQIL